MRRYAPSSPDGSDFCQSHADAVNAAGPLVDEANDAAGKHRPRHPPTRRRMDELDAILARLARADRRPRDFRMQDRTSHLAARVAQAIEILDPRQELLADWSSHDARDMIDTPTGQEDVDALGRQGVEHRQGRIGRGDLARLTSSLDTLCSILSRDALRFQSEIPVLLQDLNSRIERLDNRAARLPVDLSPVLSELARLNDRVTVLGGEWKHQSVAFEALAERLSADVRAPAGAPAAAFEALLGRIERLDDGVREVAQRLATSPVELMLRTIGEKLETRPFPANEASAETERGLDAVKESLVEIKALHLRSDRKTQQALQGIHETLETVIARPAPDPDGRPGPHAASDDLPADRLEAAVRRLQAVAISQVEAVTSADHPVSPASPVAPEEKRGPPRSEAGSDAGSRGRFGASFSPPPDESGGVRASFIAAARRATQSVVSTDVAPEYPGREEGARPDDNQAHEAERLIDRLKRTLDNHKRPLALAWGALLLGCGAISLAPDTAHAQGMVEASSSVRPVIRPAGGENCQLPFTPGAL